jgi:molecular chaperone HscB
VNNSRAQPVRDVFELFSIKSEYDIDLVDLKNRYRELQLKFHPDQYSSDAISEKMAAVTMSSLLNDGFEILSNSVKRAQYLLERAGINLQNDRSIEAEILVEQIELREQLEAIVQVSNLDDKEEKLEQLSTHLQNLFQTSEKQFSAVSKAGFNNPVVLQQLKSILVRMLFVNKLISELNRSLEALD